MRRKLFRGMLEHDGCPLVARSAKALGVRIEGSYADVQVDSDGLIRPGHGLSVAPDDPYLLPEHRRGKDFDGSADHPTWFLYEDLVPTRLEFWQDDLRHGVIGPVSAMPMTEYESELNSTASDWEIACPT